MKRQNIVIIGQGEIGRAVHALLKKNHHASIECWDVDVKACPVKKPLEEIIPSADVIFLCIPSWAIRIAAKDLCPVISTKTIIVSVSKGLDRNTGETVDQLLPSVFPSKQKLALLSGPMLAEELWIGKLGAAVVASDRPAVRSYLLELFKGTQLKLSPTSDARGAALCGVLKNVYAIGFGASAELGAGDNFRGYYMMRALAEMDEIIVMLGGERKTAYSYAGLGDFVATAFSEFSKNHEYGRTLAKIGKVTFDCEGSVSIRPLLELLGKRANKFPLLTRIAEIITHKRQVKAILEF